MPKIKDNSIYFNDEEAKEYKAKLDTIASIPELIQYLKDIYASVGAVLEINWNPIFTYHKDRSNVIPSLKGPIKGRILNAKGELHKSLYGLSFETPDYRSSFDKLANIQTGSGGGGQKWSYYYGLIDVRDFPAMVNQYETEITEALVQQEQDKFQAAFDKECDAVLKTIESVAASVNKNDPFIQKTEYLLKSAANMINQINSKLEIYRTTKITEEVTKAKITIPTTTSPFISTSRYNTIQQRLASFSLAPEDFKNTLSKAEAEFNKFMSTSPEFFV